MPHEPRLSMEQALKKAARRRQLWYNAAYLYPDLETFRRHWTAVQEGIARILTEEFGRP